MKKMISTKPVNQIDIINQLLKPFDARITIFSRTPQDSFIHFQELPKKPTNGDRTTISIGRTANNQLSYSNYQKNSLTVESLKRFREGTDYDTTQIIDALGGIDRGQCIRLAPRRVKPNDTNTCINYDIGFQCRRS